MRFGTSVPSAGGGRPAAWRLEVLTRRWLDRICLLVLCVTLYAGLTPFHAPKNTVAWIPHLNALRVGPLGTLRSAGAIPPPSSLDGARSLEFWIQPRRAEDSSTFLAFYDPTRPLYLSFGQSISDLKIELSSPAAWRRAKGRRFYVNEAFRDMKSAFWTVTETPNEIAIFRDGVSVMRARGFPMGGPEFSGDLVLGTAPTFDHTWQGVVRGLAIYDRALSPDRVAHHYRTWTKQSAPDVDAEDRCIAFYRFDERAGRVVHNRTGTGKDLQIPEQYRLVNPRVLDPVWATLNGTWAFWKDALINTVGFMPMGFFVCAWFSARGRGRSALLATALGAILSLFIELVQVRLPTRDSSMSDLITNIAGAAVGAIACVLTLPRFTRAALPARLGEEAASHGSENASAGI